MEEKYRRMLAALASKPDTGPADWSVYILRCADGSFYTGVTNDVEARVGKHNSRKGAAYTRTRVPVELLYREDSLTRSQALVREAAIKRMPRPQKERLVSANDAAPRSKARRPANPAR